MSEAAVDNGRRVWLISTCAMGGVGAAAVAVPFVSSFQPSALTMITRSRAGSGGTDYIFTLLRSYYRDDMIAHGWNNLAFPNVAMPNPLWYLQGERRPIIETVANADGSSTQVLRGWEQVTPGTMSPEEFDRSVAELVAFLDWLAEPHQDQRQQLGIFVLLFLAGFTVLAWKLNKEYWKDIK